MNAPTPGFNSSGHGTVPGIPPWRDRIRVLSRTAIVAFAGIWAAAGVAQTVPIWQEIPAEFLENTRERPADAILFCVNGDSVTAQFDRAIGQAIADTLLLNAGFLDIQPDFHYILDYAIPLEEYQLYVYLFTQCDAMLGYPYPFLVESQPTWLTVTRPYYETREVVIANDASVASLRDLAPGRTIGARVGTYGDALLLQYNLAQQPAQRWTRLPYVANPDLLVRFAAGGLDAAVVWEPALAAASRDGTIHLDELHAVAFAPVAEKPLPFALALMGTEAYLRGLLDQAIATIVGNGQVAQLLADTQTPGKPYGGSEWIAAALAPAAESESAERTSRLWMWLAALAGAALLGGIALRVVRRRNRS